MRKSCFIVRNYKVEFVFSNFSIIHGKTFQGTEIIALRQLRQNKKLESLFDE